MEEIKLLGYESLRYSFSMIIDQVNGKFGIEFDSTSEHYFVYATMDRASYNKKIGI